MRAATIQAVRQQFGFRCGYCGISETDAGAALTVDHFQPQPRGGTDDFTNLVYCCHACNQHKNDLWNPRGVQRILHPMQDTLTDHFTEQDDGSLLALSDTGRFHIARLQLNRPALIRHRRTERQGEKDRRDRAAVVDLMSRAEDTLQRLEAFIRATRLGGE